MRLIRNIIIFSLIFCCIGCAFSRKHPIVVGLIGGGVAGVTVGLITRSSCPPTANGYLYSGTPPCPGKNYDPGPGKKK